jgi:hypothetical protein
MTKKRFSVFVGGGEVNDSLLDKTEAKALAEFWKEKGYDDVVIFEYPKSELNKKI